MSATRLKPGAALKDQRGFTLPEVMVVILIMGILFAIAMASWNSVIESRRVDSAANQLAADLRLAHSSAVNQLTDWRVVVVLNRGDASAGPDYYLMKLNAPYPSNPLSVAETIPRTFDGNVSANQTTYNDQGDSNYPTGYAAPPGSPTPTLTFEFNSDGSEWTYPAVAGSVCVTVDGNPLSRVYVQSATSRVEVRNVAC